MSRKIRYKNSFSQREMYNSYKKHRKLKPYVTREDFFKIVATFNREVIKLILYKNYSFNIPFGLGSLKVVKKKKNGYILDDEGNVIEKDLVIDRRRTWQLWKNNPKAREDKKYVYHLNEHTDGYVYRFFWDRKGVSVQNITSYKFNTIRANKRWLYSILTDEDLEVDFFEIKPY